MSFFATNLLLHTLQGIVEEIEQVDPNSPVLVQLKQTILQKSGELSRSDIEEDEHERIVSAE